MSSNITTDSGSLPPIPRTPDFPTHQYETIDEDFTPRPAADNLRIPVRRDVSDSAAGRSHIVLRIPTQCPAPVRRHRVHVVLALGIVVAMATTVGLFVKFDKQVKELQEELHERDVALTSKLRDVDQHLRNSIPEGT